MQDRFKFRYFDYGTIYEVFAVDFMNKTAQLVSLDRKETLIKRIDTDKLIQCTGLKDENGKLIYEGDILKGKKNMICSAHSSKMVDKIGVVEIPQNMFVASCRDIKNNCTLFCQNDWIKTKVIGNIYQNMKLLEVKND